MQDKKKSNFPPFPSDNTSQSEKKGLEWNKKWIKAAYEESSRQVVGNYEDNRKNFVNLRKYADGSQDKDKYKNLLSSDGNTAYLNLNYDVGTPAPSIIESLVGRLENQSMRVGTKTISPIAKTAYDKEYKRLKAQKLLASKKDELAKLGVDISGKVNESEVAKTQSEDELELHMQMNFKDAYALFSEKVIDFILTSNKFPKIKRKLFRDLVVCKRAVVYSCYDEDLGVKVELTDIVNFVSDYSNRDDFSDTKWRGQFNKITIDELAKTSDFNEGELAQIAKTAANNYGNSDWDSNWDLRYYDDVFSSNRPYGSFKVNVFNAEYKSHDEYEYEEVPQKNGGSFYRRLDLKTKDGDKKKQKNKKNEVIRKRLNNIYKAKLVCGTDFIYDYGLKENLLRDKNSGFGHSSDTHFSWTIISPDMYEMRSKSIMEKLTPMIDELILVRLQAQRVLANMTPQGVAVDVATVAMVASALGEESITPRMLQDIYKQTGNYYYSSLKEDGEPIINPAPIKELPPPDLSTLQFLEAQAASIIQNMGLVSGVPISTVGAPDVRALVGNEKIAAENRNDATRFIDDAYKDLLERLANKIILTVQDSIEYGDMLDFYSNAIGESFAQTGDFAKNFTGVQLGMFIEVAPDIAEQAFFEQSLISAMQTDKIKQSDVYVLRDMAKTSLKASAKYMQLWEDKYNKEKLEASAAQSQAQSEAAAQAAMMAEQAKQQTLQLEWNLKSQYLQLEYQLKERLSAVDHKEKVNEQLVDGDVKEELIEKAAEVQEQQLKKTEKGEAMAGSMPAIMGGQPSVGTAAGTSNMTAPSRQ